MAVYTKGFKTFKEITADGNYCTSICLIDGAIEIESKTSLLGYFPEPNPIDNIPDDIIVKLKRYDIIATDIIEYYSDNYNREVIVYKDKCDGRCRIVSIVEDGDIKLIKKHDDLTRTLDLYY